MDDLQYTWPYDRMMGDIYFNQCPYCGEENVLTGMNDKAYQQALEGIKTTLVMPCCHHKMVIRRADTDYFWTTERLR